METSTLSPIAMIKIVVILVIVRSANESARMSKKSKNTLHLSLITSTRWSISKYSRMAEYNGSRPGSIVQKYSGLSSTLDDKFTSLRFTINVTGVWGCSSLLLDDVSETNISACLVKSGKLARFLDDVDDLRRVPCPFFSKRSDDSVSSIADVSLDFEVFSASPAESLSRASSSNNMLSVGLLLTKNWGSYGSNSLLCCCSSTRLPAGLIFGDPMLWTSPS
ncbi:hypothetical protein OGAPHI_001245 [Ogataea philodendri]|uniref:Secreted protein n=1 Tax=Ogataea philodendri TaxID=1378263 RepID=A0A9P8T9W3_9ASCO|nr:uncharacterized protein OGAPHI_001245 [Ogataea philodendri]KAH3670730.1 hypothetical protein OGAPHI_001245 [Ogataea philodendri]